MLIKLPLTGRILAPIRKRGYACRNILEIVQSDNETDSIVFTSPQFQPAAESFSDRYLFVGPSLGREDGLIPPRKESRGKKQADGQEQPSLVYISLGTVLGKREEFFRACIEALGGQKGMRAILSVGKGTDMPALGEIPGNIEVQPFTDQLSILSEASVFLTHCGMNSASEGLYYGVPLLCYPLTGEEGGVAQRVCDLGAGRMLHRATPEEIRENIRCLLTEDSYRQAAMSIRQGFLACPGPCGAADKIEGSV